MTTAKYGLPARLLLAVGSMGPLGYLPASGTVTVALVGFPLAYMLHSQSRPMYFAVTLAVTLLAGALHSAGDRLLGTKDSSRLVWDEIVGFLIAVSLLDVFTWPLWIAAFLLERGLDILKVPPANFIERRWPGAWGVVGDDVVAGVYTCAILTTIIYLRPERLGA